MKKNILQQKMYLQNSYWNIGVNVANILINVNLLAAFVANKNLNRINIVLRNLFFTNELVSYSFNNALIALKIMYLY